MSVSYWLDRSAQLPLQSFDAIIVGGGITGFSLAYWLNQQDPTLNVAILEKTTLGAGATGRNAGFVTCGSVEHFSRMVEKHGPSEAFEIWQFSEENKRLLQQRIVKNHEAQIGFETRGSFSLASLEPEWLELQASAELMKKSGISVDLLSQLDTQKRLGTRGFVGAIHYLGDASVNPSLLLSCLKEHVQASVFENTEAFEIISNSTLKKVVTSMGHFEAPLVLLALNGYSSQLSSYFQDKIYPTRGQILALEPTTKVMEGPCYAHSYLDYFRQLPNGQVLVGGFRQLERETETGYSDHTTPRIQSALEEFVQKHLPFAQGKRITHRWAGVMGFSFDGQPLVGSLPTDPQIFFCGGYTGHGLGLAFHCAKVTIDLVYGKKPPRWLSARRA